MGVAEDREFQEVMTALHTRENTTATVATLASSASLILFGVLGLKNLEGFTGTPNMFLIGTGFAFPILGEAYRELTILTIDGRNLARLRALIGLERFDRLYSSSGPLYDIARFARRSIVRILLLLPSFLWSLVGNFQTYVPGFLNSHPFWTAFIILCFVLTTLEVADYEAKTRYRSKPVVVESVNMTDSSASYFAAKATIYRDAATIFGIVFGFAFAVLLAVLTVDATNSTIATITASSLYVLLGLVALLGGILVALMVKMLGYDRKAADAEKKKSRDDGRSLADK